MRVIAKRTLKEFWERPGCTDAERPLTEWHNMMLKAIWTTPQELKAEIGTASIIKGGRVVFNIAGNKYRLVVAIKYDLQIAWVKFIGTHPQYDQIDVETV
ncbi:type II toxin-antitoxin system HigB family toxin [Pseudomonas sp. LS1212]|uniref:type II toxin-antitoxin system HigB family toxin n=1 Tax=Pseudomonas sp. LS1212 TaxID=2972478 RepID=UPI00215D063E|nr:type II toxin-antitoxin system HigB family toxin [Pseudomonas sp. LS1212]UVJ45179.1 type II toxin-antitoxin system HigB family toxin [Pseudomonas sp. LS1212]